MGMGIAGGPLGVFWPSCLVFVGRRRWPGGVLGGGGGGGHAETAEV